jgi:hypothetical protein
VFIRDREIKELNSDVNGRGNLSDLALSIVYATKKKKKKIKKKIKKIFFLYYMGNSQRTTELISRPFALSSFLKQKKTKINKILYKRK